MTLAQALQGNIENRPQKLRSGKPQAMRAIDHAGMDRTRPNSERKIGSREAITKTGKKAGDWTSRATGGDWTAIQSWDRDTQEMEIKFNNGFVAVYPNVDQKMYNSAQRGATTKGEPRRTGSVGAWLHKHPNVMRNYKEGL